MSQHLYKTILLTSNAGAWVVPDDWTTENRIITIGGGGGGGRGKVSQNSGPGGAGGSCVWESNIRLSYGQTVYFAIGNGGTGATVSPSGGANGGITWINYNTNSPPTNNSEGLLASGGRGGGFAANVGGNTQGMTASIGGNISAGGNGANGRILVGRGGGGGGAAGVWTPSPAFNSGNGALGSNSVDGGGGGGGGVRRAGNTTTNIQGANGGFTYENTLGTGTLVTGSNGNFGSSGGGGAGGAGRNTNSANAFRGGNGGTGVELEVTILNNTELEQYTPKVTDNVFNYGIKSGSGGGGGGGGGTDNTGANGGAGANGGLYGGGGGGGGSGVTSAGNGGDGAPGAIFITYYPKRKYTIIT